MKLPRLLFLITALSPLYTIAQDSVNGPAKSLTYISYPFTKGKSGFQLERNLSYRYRNESFDGNDLGHTSDLGLNVSWKKFVANGIGVGFDLSAGWAGDFNGTDSKNRDWTLYGNFTWGKGLGINSNIYIELGAGYGRNNSILETPSGDFENVSSMFGARAEVGFPLNMSGNTYATPQLFAQYYNEDFDDGKEKTFRYGAGVILEGYVSKGEKLCDCKNGYPFSRELYQAGTSYIGYHSKGMISFSDRKLTQDNIPGEQEDQYNKGHLKVSYGRFIANYVAVGVGIQTMNNVQKSEDADYRVQSTSFSVLPHILMNIPVDNGWNNFFIQLEGGIGTRKFETEYAGNVNEDKYSTTSFGAGLGYNMHFTPGLALTGKLGYDWRFSKQEDEDEKEKRRGLTFEVGVHAFFGKNIKYQW